MTQETTMPQPTAEHTRMQEMAGTWNVDCTFFMGPEEMKVEAKETVEAFGPFFVLSSFETEMFGAPFAGRASLGYDPGKKQYVSTWCDTMTPQLYVFTGGYDASGKVLEMKGEGHDCMSGGNAAYRTTEEHKGPDERVFEMFMTPAGGEEIKLFTHVYKRA